MDEKEAEARPIMGTIFLVLSVALDIPKRKKKCITGVAISRRLLLGERSEPHTGVFNRDFA